MHLPPPQSCGSSPGRAEKMKMWVLGLQLQAPPEGTQVWGVAHSAEPGLPSWLSGPISLGQESRTGPHLGAVLPAPAACSTVPYPDPGGYTRATSRSTDFLSLSPGPKFPERVLALELREGKSLHSPIPPCTAPFPRLPATLLLSSRAALLGLEERRGRLDTGQCAQGYCSPTGILVWHRPQPG